MSQKQPKLDRNNPFLGLRPFSEREQDYFKGRETEIGGLLRCLKREVLTVLFGVSGLGKTSLLRAGLFPLARANGYFPILIRLSFGDEEASGTEQIKAFVSAAMEKENVDAPLPEQDESLWRYFHRVQFWSACNDLLTPVLVFDQFEELFTLGQRSPGVIKLVGELASLIENRIPVSDQHSLAEMDELPFSIEQQNYRVILSLREDFLADLESLQKKIPSLGINRMRLKPMNGMASLQVVSQVPGLIEDDVAEQVVRIVGAEASDTPLTDFEIEPALLSVFCRELNNKRLERGDEQITEGLLEGSKEQILHEFYQKSVEKFDGDVRRFIEEEMLTKTGYRNSVALEDALEQSGVTDDVISELINDRLVRVEERAGVKRVELTHDLLTREIKSSRDLRRRKEADVARRQAEVEAEKTRKKLHLSKLINVAFLVLFIISVFTGIMWWNQLDETKSAEVKVEEVNTELAATLKKAYEVSRSVLELQRLLDQGVEGVDPSELRRVSAAIFDANKAFSAELIPALLSEASALMQSGKLSEESGRDALETYQLVLVLDLRNVEAQRGLDDIASRYLKQAEEKLNVEDFENAARLANNGLLAGPGSEELERVRDLAVSNLNKHQKSIQQTLREAQDLVQEGNLLLPPDNNAKQKFEQVLEQDPNNMQANRGLTLLPEQVNREIIQLRNTKNWADGQKLAGVAKRVFSSDPRFVAYADYFDDRVGRLNSLLDELYSLSEKQETSPKVIDEVGKIFTKLVVDYPSEPAVLEERGVWINRLKQEASIELIEQALEYFPDNTELKNLQQMCKEQDRLALLDAGIGQLEIVILPWGEILEIRDAQGQVVSDPNVLGTTPRTLSLPTGNYTVIVRTINGDSNEDPEIVEAEVMAQHLSRIIRNFSALDEVTYFERIGW